MSMNNQFQSQGFTQPAAGFTQPAAGYGMTPPPPSYGAATTPQFAPAQQSVPPQQSAPGGGVSFNGTVHPQVLPTSQNAEVVGLDFHSKIFKLAIVGTLLFSPTGLPALYYAYMAQHSSVTRERRRQFELMSSSFSTVSLMIGIILVGLFIFLDVEECLASIL